MADVRRRFTLQRVVWVADWDMVSTQALHVLSAGQDRYLIGLPRWRSPQSPRDPPCLETPSLHPLWA
jgi:hypothetical protein